MQQGLDRLVSPAGIAGERPDGEVPIGFQLHGGATDELLQPRVGRIGFEQAGVDLFRRAGAGQVAPVDARTDCGRVPVLVDALDVGSLRLIPAGRGV